MRGATTASKADLRAAGAVLVWGVVGAAATRATWHSVLGIDVTGADLGAGQVALVAFALAVFLAGFTLLAAGPLLGRAILACGLVASGALGKYAWDLRAARAAVLESGVGRGIAGGASVRVGAIVAAVAAVAVIVSSPRRALSRSAGDADGVRVRIDRLASCGSKHPLYHWLACEASTDSPRRLSSVWRCPAIAPAARAQGPRPDAESLWSDDAEATDARLTALLPGARAAGDGAYTACLLAQLARAQTHERRFDDARMALDEAEGYVGADMREARVRILIERGHVAIQELRVRLSVATQRTEAIVAKALEDFRAAWDVAREARLDVLALRAESFIEQQVPPAEWRAWNARALEVAEKSSDPAARRERGERCMAVACDFAGSPARSEHWTALESFRKAAAYFDEEKRADDARDARWEVGFQLRFLGRADEALAAQQALARECAAAGATDAKVLEEIGECLADLGRDAEARPWFARAYDVLSEDRGAVRHQAERLARLKRLSST